MALIYSGLCDRRRQFRARAADGNFRLRVSLRGERPRTHAAPRKVFDGSDWLFWTASLSALFACVDFYYQFPAPAGYEQQFIWLETGVFRRAQGVFYEASTLGNLCAFFLVMIAVALFRPRRAQSFSPFALLAGGFGVGRGAGVVVFARIADQPGGGDGGAGLVSPRSHPLAARGAGCGFFDRGPGAARSGISYL